MKQGLALALLLVASLSWGEETEITFASADQTPVFRITSVLVEPSGVALTSDVTEVLKKMELLTLAPATIRLPNGDYLLNWGGTEEFNRSFTLRADGTPQTVHLRGNRTAALWSLGVAGSAGLATLVMAPLAVRDAALVPWAAGTALGAVGGLVGLLLFSPHVEVSQAVTP